MTANAQHLCKSAELYTPEVYVEAGRLVLGGIDLDPASCAEANETVRASKFYTWRDDGRRQPWFGHVFVNPPGDRRGELVRAFWRRACAHALYGGPDAVVLWVGFSLEQLRTLQRCKPLGGTRCPTPLDFPIVILADRIDWVRGRAESAQLQLDGLGAGDEQLEETSGSPTHGNYFCLLGGGRAERTRFRKTFGPFGDYLPGRSKQRSKTR